MPLLKHKDIFMSPLTAKGNVGAPGKNRGGGRGGGCAERGRDKRGEEG